MCIFAIGIWYIDMILMNREMVEKYLFSFFLHFPIAAQHILQIIS